MLGNSMKRMHGSMKRSLSIIKDKSLNTISDKLK